MKDNDEEDVDIDDDMPVTSFPPVMIEKDEGAGVVVGGGLDQDHGDRGNASSSSSGSGSSSSDSSSSSGIFLALVWLSLGTRCCELGLYQNGQRSVILSCFVLQILIQEALLGVTLMLMKHSPNT